MNDKKFKGAKARIEMAMRRIEHKWNNLSPAEKAEIIAKADEKKRSKDILNQKLTTEQIYILNVRIHNIKHQLNSIGHTFQDALPKPALKLLEECICSYYKFMNKLGIPK